MKSLRYLNKYLLRYKYRLILGILFVSVSNVFAIFQAQIIREAFNMVQIRLSEDVAAELLEKRSQLLASFTDDLSLGKVIVLFAVLVLLMAVLKGLFTFFTRQTIIIMSRLIEFDLKNDIFKHYQVLSTAFYKRNNTGDIMNRISEDVSRVRMYLGPGIMYSINMITLFVMVIVTMWSKNPELTLYSLAPLPVLSILIYYVSRNINQRSEGVQRQLSTLSTIAQESFSGIRILKSFVREASTEKYFEKNANEYKDRSLGLVKVEATFMPVMMLLIGLSTILTVYIGGKAAISGEIMIGDIAEFIIYVNMLTWPVTAIGWVTSLTQRAAASQERINEFLKEKGEIENQSEAAFEPLGEIEFKHVSFTYEDSGIEAVKDISFKVEPGQTLAIVGKTGAGKSTVAHLITRLYDVTSGEVLIDNHPIQSINLKDWRTHIGFVPQEVFLFSETIFNNIAFGVPDDQPDSDMVIQAAKDAEVHQNIIGFKDGYETLLGERGITLSGGQKQRLSIARAIVKDPRLLIFDDSLSAIDAETEVKIMKNLRQVGQAKTTVIVSHRISAIQHADLILVMDKGMILERGDHKTLMEKQGVYYEMYMQQEIREEKLT